MSVSEVPHVVRPASPQPHQLTLWVQGWQDIPVDPMGAGLVWDRPSDPTSTRLSWDGPADLAGTRLVGEIWPVPADPAGARLDVELLLMIRNAKYSTITKWY